MITNEKQQQQKIKHANLSMYVVLQPPTRELSVLPINAQITSISHLVKLTTTGDIKVPGCRHKLSITS